jgi:hypothetical protein
MEGAWSKTSHFPPGRHASDSCRCSSGSYNREGQVILSITRGMGKVVLELLVAQGAERDEQRYVDDMVAASAATVEAIERALASTYTQKVRRRLLPYVW